MPKKSYFSRSISRTLPTTKMELFVTIVYGSKPCNKVLSQGVPSQMLVVVLDLLLIVMVLSQIPR